MNLRNTPWRLKPFKICRVRRLTTKLSAFVLAIPPRGSSTRCDRHKELQRVVVVVVDAAEPAVAVVVMTSRVVVTAPGVVASVAVVARHTSHATFRAAAWAHVAEVDPFPPGEECAAEWAVGQIGQCRLVRLVCLVAVWEVDQVE